MQVTRPRRGNMATRRSYRSGICLPCLADVDDEVGVDHTNGLSDVPRSLQS